MESRVLVVSSDDLLREILLRLPLKPLAQFLSVSKRWNAVITHPIFLSALDKKRTPASGVIFQIPSFRSSAESYITLVASFRKYDSQVLTTLDEFTGIQCPGLRGLNSCNGLLLCRSDDDDPVRSRYRYYVCDIAANKYWTVPKFDGWRRRRTLEGMCLAFDPSKSPHYRVVCVWRLVSLSDEYGIEVFSSETGCWSKRENPWPFRAHVNFERGVYWNGAINWINTSDNTLTHKSIYFDPAEDQIPKVMPNPPLHLSRGYCCVKFRNDYYFGESCGHLHFINGKCSLAMVLEVHEMKRDYSTWFIKYKVNVDSAFYCDRVFNIKMSTLVRGKEEEDSFLVVMMGGKLVRYSFAYNTLEIIWEYKGDEPKESSHIHPVSFPPMDWSLQYIIN